MNKPTVSQIDADMRIARTLGIEEQQIGGLEFGQRDFGEHCSHGRRAARKHEIKLPENVVDQAAAIETLGGGIARIAIRFTLHTGGIRDQAERIERSRGRG